MKITIPEKSYGIIDFCDIVAKEMGYSSTDELRYDTRKVKIAKNIKHSLYKHYAEKAKEADPIPTESEFQFGMAISFALMGPYVDENLKANEVEIFDGFIS